MQCLQTSEDISQRKPSTLSTVSTSGIAAWVTRWSSTGIRCSMNATWRQVVAPSAPVLSSEVPRWFIPSAGTSFHSLQATSQALQPMHSEVSVKNPTRVSASSP